MQTDPNTAPHPCEAQPLEPMPSEPPGQDDKYRAEWWWAGEPNGWMPRRHNDAVIARLRAALHAKDAECETMKSLIAEHLANDARRICEIRNLRAEVERLKGTGWRDAGEVDKEASEWACLARDAYTMAIDAKNEAWMNRYDATCRKYALPAPPKEADDA